MRKYSAIILLAIAITASSSLFAQNISDNPLGQNQTGKATYFALESKFTSLNQNEPVLIAGGRFGWNLKRSSIGLGLNFLITPHKLGNSDNTVNLSLWYLGLVYEHRVYKKENLNLILNSLIGLGNTKQKRNLDKQFWYSEMFNNSNVFLFVFEPGFGAELVLNNFSALLFGINYRFIAGNDVLGNYDIPMNGFSGTITVKFEAF